MLEVSEKKLDAPTVNYFQENTEFEEEEDTGPRIQDILAESKTLIQSAHPQGQGLRAALDQEDVDERHAKMRDTDMLDLDHSDYEGDMDEDGASARKAKQKTRADFKTEEEWTAYQETRALLPENAFAAFGQLESDSSGKHGKGFKKRPRGPPGNTSKKDRQRLDREFVQLDKVYEKKYGTGLSESSKRQRTDK